MRLQLRGRAASQVDGLHRLALQVVAPHAQLRAQGVRVTLPEQGVDGGIEVAVQAARLAEGDMDIDAGHGVYL